jgi:hypothetical protein
VRHRSALTVFLERGTATLLAENRRGLGGFMNTPARNAGVLNRSPRN